MYGGWASRWDQGEPEPWPELAEGERMRLMGGRVNPPPGADPLADEYDRAPVKPKRRASPGDPRCADCRDSRCGFCDTHRDFHAEYDPLRGIG